MAADRAMRPTPKPNRRLDSPISQSRGSDWVWGGLLASKEKEDRRDNGKKEGRNDSKKGGRRRIKEAGKAEQII